jgi:YVTN family beta-propeller protein
MKFKFVLGLGIIVLSLTACSGNIKVDKVTENTTVQVEENKSINNEVVNSFYFTADEGGSISKIDANSNKVVNTIYLDGSVHNVQISPDGSILGAVLVPAGHGHESSTKSPNGFALFYDSNTDQLIKKVEVGKHPAHIVFTEDERYVLVTNSEDNTVSVLDGSNYDIVGTITTGKGPHGFRITQDSKYAYIANTDEDTISVLNLELLKEDKRIKVGKTPVTTAMTKDGRFVLVTLHAEDSIAVVDTTTDTVTKIPVGVGPAQVYIQSDDRFAFVANQGTETNPSNTVSKIDLNTMEIVATITTGQGAHGVAFSQDNKFVYITNMFEDTVSVIDNEGNKVIDTFEVGKIPNGITYKK